jgi:hypothetical protein
VDEAKLRLVLLDAQGGEGGAEVGEALDILLRGEIRFEKSPVDHCRSR